MSDKFKFCCPVMELACSRANANQRVGIQTGTMFQTKKTRMTTRIVVVIYFPKAKKADEGKYGFKSKYKDTRYAHCRWCPFCGARLEKEEPAQPGSGDESSHGLAQGQEEPGAI